MKKVQEAKEEELYNYDLVFLGTPSHMWQPPVTVQEYIKARMDYYRKLGSIKLCAPKVPGKKAVVFVTSPAPILGSTKHYLLGNIAGNSLSTLGLTWSENGML